MFKRIAKHIVSTVKRVIANVKRRMRDILDNRNVRGAAVFGKHYALSLIANFILAIAIYAALMLILFIIEMIIVIIVSIAKR